MFNESGETDGEEAIIRQGDANVYVYNPALDEEKRLSDGSFDDIKFDPYLAEPWLDVIVTTNSTSIVVPAPVYGMMDYIFARYYKGKPADIVIYRNYPYDYVVR